MRTKESDVYRRIRLLGQGSFGQAYLGEYVKDKSLCVIKQMDLKFLSEEEKQESYREARIMAQLKHPNIINFREVYKTVRGRLCIVMDYAEGGDLSQVLERAETAIPEPKILDWFTQICLAVKHCHDRKIVHRDIKTKNLFITKDQRIKLGDFGIAKLLNHTREKINTMVGTPYYLAPELLENKPYSFKGDIWALGVVLYEMCCRCPPFMADNLPGLALKIVRGNFNPVQGYSRELKILVNQLLTVNADRRPTVHQILRMPLITNRIKNFLSETIKRSEFDHTVLHNERISLDDRTFVMLDDEEIRVQTEVQTTRQKQLPEIKSPFLPKKQPMAQMKKLPKIVDSQIKPPVTRQLSSRKVVTRQQPPSTPDLKIKNIPSKGRFITKESPDSFQGSDPIIENPHRDQEIASSPKFFQPPKVYKRNSERLTKLDNEVTAKILKSDDDSNRKVVHQPKYRLQINANGKSTMEQIIKKRQSNQDEYSQREEASPPMPSMPHVPKLLHRISEEGPGSLVIQETTLNDFQHNQDGDSPRKEIQIQSSGFESTHIKRKPQGKYVSVDAVKTDEEQQSKKKVYKIIFKDPFQKIPKQLRNSEDDLRDMLVELKGIVGEKQIRNETIVEQEQENEQIYDDESEDESVPQQQINTWIHGNSREESQLEIEREKNVHTFQCQHLKSQLINRLGHNFEVLYKVASFSSHLQDLGKQNLKQNILDFVNVDEKTADGLATLLITLVIQQSSV